LEGLFSEINNEEMEDKINDWWKALNRI